jgi:hypothetical protein
MERQSTITRAHPLGTTVFIFAGLLVLCTLKLSAQNHPEIYIKNNEKGAFLTRLNRSGKTSTFVAAVKSHLDPYVERHQEDPEWIVSRLQMYWNTKYQQIYVNGMDFSHGEGKAPVPTVRFSGSRDWATDYLQPELEDVRPYMDDPRGLYLQNGKKAGQPWEWVKPSETGHIIERINEEIMKLAEEAAFLYWLTEDDKYAVFAHDIFMKYTAGMYYRDPPLTVEDHKNALLMGLQTFEVIHERVVEHLTVCYDFLYDYLRNNQADLDMIQSVFQKWADQEIKYGVPGNNWNLMQALYITYLALALENDQFYENGKGQEYYIDQVLNQNSEKQKALKDVVKNYDQETGVWPEVAGYNMLVANDMLEIFMLMDNTLNNNLVAQYPIIEKANLVIFQYLFPNGFTVAYGDAKHSRMRFNALELLLSNYQKYNLKEKENLITAQLKKFMADGAYSRDEISSLFQLFFYVEDLSDVPAATSFSDLVSPTFYAPNVSWLVQRNGNSPGNGMMISENASLGNHSHTNGVNIELFAKGMVIAPDCAAGVSYWTEDHRDYYSRFAAHNTVVVDGISDYRNMRGSQAFELNAIYPAFNTFNPLVGDYTFSDVTFIEPSTDAIQQRLTGTIRTSESTGYFVDIFRSARKDGQDKKHEYLFHGQGEAIVLFDDQGNQLSTVPTDELASAKGDLVGYDYFSNKSVVDYADNFMAQFSMPSVLDENLKVNLWMKGQTGRKVFTVEAPYSRAINSESVPESLYHKPLPTLVVRQEGEANSRPFVSIIDAFNEGADINIEEVAYFSPKDGDPDFVGIQVHTSNRIDFIYNAENGNKNHVFMDGYFQGTYGIVSYLGDNILNMLLGNGNKLAHGAWKIEASEAEGAILVMADEQGVQVDAQKAFKLTMPLSKKTKKVFLEYEMENKAYIIEGKIDKKHKLVAFELPALIITKLKIVYNHN